MNGVLDNIDQLRDQIAIINGVFLLRGHSKPDDGGGGIFYWHSANNEQDDNGYYVVSRQDRKSVV